jgi:uncharacterized cofD-like protein
MKTLRIVGIGGGTGLPVLLAGLGKETGVDLSAIVAVSDNGGSSGRLRESFAMPAIGDLRNCLVALSGSNSGLAELFQHRFSGGGELDGHAVGNLIVAALYQKTGSLRQALEIASGLFPTRGRALAATETPSTLCAAFQDGTIVRGESHITATGRPIERVWLEPDSPPASPGVLEAIRSADAVVLAPGSLFTSLIPNLLVDGIADAIRESHGAKMMICNLMTQPGETDGFSASDHLRVVQDYLGRGVVEYCVMNSAVVQIPARYGRTEPVACDLAQIRSLGIIPVKADLLMRQIDNIRHDPTKLARMVVKITRAKNRHAVGFEQPQSFQKVAFQCLT